MKTGYLSLKIIFPFLIFLGFLFPTLGVAQQTANTSADSTAIEIEVIPMSQISIKSGEVWTQSSRLYESLLADEEIDKMKMKNDSLVDNISSLLKTELTTDLSNQNVRYLNNKRVYWRKFGDVLVAEKTSLASNIKTLNQYKHDFEDEVLIWENTKEAIKKENAEPTVVNRVVELISQMKVVINNVQNKNDRMLAMLDRTTAQEVGLVEYIDRIDKELVEKKSEVFVQDQLPLYSINYADSANWKFKEPISLFYQTEVVALWKYVNDYIPYFGFQLVLIIALIIGFSMIKRKLLKTDIINNTIYEQMLRKIFSRNISAAIILGIFASVLIFPNRPELFKDIMILVVTVPLLIIASTLVDKIFNKFLFLFGLIIYLKFVYTIFPPENLYSTITMVAVAVIQVYVLWKLAYYFVKNPFKPRLLSNLFVMLIVINLGFAIIGLMGIFYGTTTLAEVALRVPVTNIIGGILVFITAIIFDGLIDVGAGSSYFQKLNFVKLYGNSLRKKLISIVNFIAIVFWISTMLSTVNIKRGVIDGVTKFFTDEISVGSASFTLWDIVIFFLVIWLSIIIAKMIRILLEQDILNKFKLGKGVPHTIAMMVRYSIITIGVLLAVTAAGVPVNNLTVLFGAFGVGIGFGLQNIFNNIVSGFILLFERPIQIGDTIEVGQLQLTGVVKSIGIRSSNVRTFDGAEVIVPNGQLISNEVVNWTLSDRRRRIEIIAGVAYGSDTYKVKELLLKVLSDHPDIISNPEPIVLFVEMAESSLNFRMLFWTADSSNWIDIRSDVMFKIYDVLNKEGITIPFPQMDLHLKSDDKATEVKENLE
ncbi:MAG: mechanosensitive ion channel [Bacteroidota bacterium]